uniref:hypothetical protein n=1 Tax=Peronosclerospora sorghi TaxID=230839 RepID=UPI0022FD4865|nr:hypothetical protein PN187_mgp36 [Peronosclerospora sorghi]WAU47950.1 hypothetical protein [Peronosclerospora sorghi]
MGIFILIKNLIIIIKIYNFFKKKNLLSISIFLIFFFLPIDLTFFDDDQDINLDEEEIKKKKIEEFKKKLPFWLFLFFSFLFIGILLVIFGDDGSSYSSSEEEEIPDEMIAKPKPMWSTPTRIKTGCPQNIGRAFDLIDVKTGKKIPTKEVTEDMLYDKNLR